MKRTFCKLQAIFAGLLIAAAGASAQTSAGSISGLVTDSSGAIVPGVSIEVTDIDRNVGVETTTNEAGFYLATPLPSGRYRITAESEGFRGFVLEPFPVATQQKAGLDIELELGQVTESITVAGTAQLIESTNSTLSGVVENKQIMDLPLNGRNVYSLAVLTPGVFTRNPARGKFREGFHSIGIFQVNGGRDSSNMIMMDGVPVTMNSNTNNMNANSALPTIEGIEEFRIQTNSYSAEYGRSGGGVLTMTTKSGTNTLHGSAFDFLRNNKMDSNNWFANRAGNDLGTFQRNEFGFSVGGPIVKNRTFFFEAFEGRRQRTQSIRNMTLPTNLQKAGDFSQTLNSAGVLRTIYDPLSTQPDPARPGEFTRDPFQDNKVPAAAMDPVALATASYYGAEPKRARAAVHWQKQLPVRRRQAQQLEPQCIQGRPPDQPEPADLRPPYGARCREFGAGVVGRARLPRRRLLHQQRGAEQRGVRVQQHSDAHFPAQLAVRLRALDPRPRLVVPGVRAFRTRLPEAHRERSGPVGVPGVQHRGDDCARLAAPLEFPVRQYVPHNQRHLLQGGRQPQHQGRWRVARQLDQPHAGVVANVLPVHRRDDAGAGPENGLVERRIRLRLVLAGNGQQGQS